MEDIRNRYKQLCKIFHPDKVKDPNKRKENTQKIKEIQNAYQDVCEWADYDPYSSVFRDMCDFDRFFRDMESQLTSHIKEPVHYYSKQTYSCTRDGKTVTKVEENVNGDIRQFESYENHHHTNSYLH
jgi:hypothetical protein